MKKQYENSAPAGEHKIAAVDQDRIGALERRISEQSAEIERMQRDLRRLRNEVRLAVNSFNLKRG